MTKILSDSMIAMMKNLEEVSSSLKTKEKAEVLWVFLACRLSSFQEQDEDEKIDVFG